ncbi:MAG: hemolysin III family protein [Dehalococcoidales bacterium]|nr:hemolysin III family protein [Dehalococcoidales bacterium]
MISIRQAEKVAAYSHLAGVVAALIGLIILLFVTWGRWDYLFVSLIYGLGSTCLFGASFMYHAQKREENALNIWRKLDHVAIFIMIAGTYTPMAYVYLEGAWFWSIIGVQWACVLAGLFFKVFYMRAPRIISPILYLLMGWMAVIPMNILWHSMSVLSFCLLAGGGVAYSAGAIIYAAKKPNPFPGVFGFHEIFHFFILLGAILHYFMVYIAVTQF